MQICTKHDILLSAYYVFCLQPRAVVISTYALCGFANVSSIGMMMGGLGSMSDKQKPIIAQLALRAMITGNIVCFMNACTAGKGFHSKVIGPVIFFFEPTMIDGDE